MRLMWQMFIWILPNLADNAEYCLVDQFIFFNVPFCDFATGDPSKHHAVCFMLSSFSSLSDYKYFPPIIT